MVSLTSTESFAARAQRSESRRVMLWSCVLAAMAGLYIVRRVFEGAVMAEDRAFWPVLGVTVFGIACHLELLFVLRRANRRGELLPPRTWRVAAVFDVATGMAPLWLLSWWSPRGPASAMSGPSLLLLPIVILLSVLRLRPWFTFMTGLGAAVFHAALAARAIVVTDAPFSLYAVYFAYSMLLLMTGMAGMLVAREVRRHVTEAATEAAARERGDQRMAAVQRDLTIARDIQVGLLPSSPPQFEGFEVAGMSRPADQTGGDYYDWQVLPDGRMIVVLADVTGHGIGPALVMAICRAYARASASLLTEPVPLMRRLNQLIHSDLRDGRFITLAIAMFEPGGRVQLLSAGHGPSFLYRAGNKHVRQFGGDGLPLGLDPDGEYDPASEFQMDEGDLLVLMTDGFYEWRRAGDGEAFGVERVEAALMASADEPPQEILRAIDQSVCAFAAGTSQSDDMTAVVIRRTSPACSSAAPPDAVVVPAA